jgi:hypothetical protein
LPVVMRVQPVLLRIDHKEGKVLDVANLVFGIDSQFGNGIKATRT